MYIFIHKYLISKYGVTSSTALFCTPKIKVISAVVVELSPPDVGAEFGA